MGHAYFRKLAGEFHPKRLIPSLVAGIISGILSVIIEISLAALIFSGDLARFVSNGIGITLFSSVVIGIVVALTSSLGGTVAVAQDIPAAILAPVAAGISASLTPLASPEATYITVVAVMAVTSLATGIGFLLMGIFHLGSLIRFIPYPVIGGFLAGTGWLLIRGSFGVMAGASLTLANLPQLFQAGMLVRWLPGLLFAILLYAIVRRFDHSLIIPGMVLAAVLGFHIVLWANSTSIAYAVARGWLLGPFPQGALWHPLVLSDLRLIHWPAILGNAGSIGTILLVSAVALLLNASGLELTVRQDVDLDRELRSAGLANLFSGLTGGTPGFQALSLSALGYRLKGGGRLVGILSACVCGLTLFFGAPLLSLLPKPVIGGLLLYLGLSFLIEWVFDAWFKMSKRDCAIILLILVAMNAVGVLPGVGLGLLVAIGLFVYDYSRTNVVRHTLSGASFRSNVDRPPFYNQYLRENADLVFILELQGFIFFGTVNKLLGQVRKRVNDAVRPCPRFIVLDFGHVSGLDSSAVESFVKMKQLAQINNIILVLSHLSAAMEERLKKMEMLTPADAVWWCTFPDMNHAVAWCEEQILQVGIVPAFGLPTLFQQLGAVLPAHDGTDKLKAYCECMRVQAGHILIQQDQPPSGLFFIEKGGAEVELELNTGQRVRLRKMTGTIVGEMSQYTGHPATASVITDQPGVIYFLSNDKLEEMEHKDPDLASGLHKFIARLLSERLTDSNHVVEALLE
jgi:sulfate permease, SulP family